MRRVLTFVRSRLAEAREAKPSQWKQGAITELEEVEDYILNLLWEDGEEA